MVEGEGYGGRWDTGGGGRLPEGQGEVVVRKGVEEVRVE